MDPGEIARLIVEQEEGYVKCPHCKNPFFTVAGSNVACPNNKCDFYNKQYYETLKQILLPRGVIDYDSLVKWFQLYVPEEQLEEPASIKNAIAWFLSYFEADGANYTTKDMAYVFYNGHPSYKDDLAAVREQVDHYLGDTGEDGEGEFFLSVFEDHFKVYRHRDTRED